MKKRLPSDEFILGWISGSMGAPSGPRPEALLARAYRAGYEQGQRDRHDAEKLAKELYGGGDVQP